MEKSARTAINDSFKELLQRKSLDKITVKEICEHCKPADFLLLLYG